MSAPHDALALARRTIEQAGLAHESRPWFSFLVPHRPAPIERARYDGPVDAFATNCEDLLRNLPSDDRVARTFAAGTRALERDDCDIYVRQMGAPPPMRDACREQRDDVEWIIPHAGPMPFLEHVLPRVVRDSRGAGLVRVTFDEPIEEAHLAMASRYPSVRFCRTQPTGLGPYVARQAALHTSTSDFLAFQDSDDVSCADRLSVQIEALRRERCDVVGCHELRLDLIERQTTVRRFPLDPASALERWPSYVLLFGTTLVKREAAVRAGGFSTTRTFGGDLQFLLRAYFACRILNVDEFLYIRRRRHDSLTTRESTVVNGPARKALARLWARDFNAVRAGTLSLAESALAAEHRMPAPAVVPLGARAGSEPQ